MDLKKYTFTDDHGHPLENCVDYISMQKEIETLRSELKDVVQALNDEERRGDEWKRRLKELWQLMYYDSGHEAKRLLRIRFLDTHPEAAEWFGEEDDADQKGLWGLEEQ